MSWPEAVFGIFVALAIAHIMGGPLIVFRDDDED